MWPPVRKDEPPPAPLINLTAQTRAETADAIANDLIWEGEQHQKPGEWQYLTAFGRGAHGEAQLWIGIRSDDHETVVEVRVHLSRVEPVTAAPPDPAMMTAWNEANEYRSALS